MNKKKPLVSVVMVTYNQAEFISEAIESIICQETNFNFEIIISDDGSTDGTEGLVRKYIEKLKETNLIINYTKHKENLGYVKNLVFSLKKSKSKYIAFLDSDDFWNDTSKLQKQYDFMENNLEYSICFHNVILIDSNKNVISDSLLNKIHNDEYTTEEIITGGVMPTASVFFRNCIQFYPKSFETIFNGDTFLFALLAQHGKAKFLSSIKNSLRRIHSNGIWGGLSDYERLIRGTNTYLKILDEIKVEYKPIVAKVVIEKIKGLLRKHLEENKYSDYLKDFITRTFLKIKYL